MTSTAMPYTGGDIKKSGELGKIFDLPVDGSRSRKSGLIIGASLRTGSFGGATSHSGQILPNSGIRASLVSGGIPGTAAVKKSNSGPLNKHGEPVKKSSGLQIGGTICRQTSGPLAPVLSTTGLITSRHISSGPRNSFGALRKTFGPLDSTNSTKLHTTSIIHNQAVTKLSQDDDYSFYKSFPKPILWAMVLLFVMGFAVCRANSIRKGAKTWIPCMISTLAGHQPRNLWSSPRVLLSTSAPCDLFGYPVNSSVKMTSKALTGSQKMEFWWKACSGKTLND